MAVKTARTTERAYLDGPAEHADDVWISTRFFTYHSDAGFVAGENITVKFVIDRPIGEVWPYASDWNTWMNPGGFYYSGVLGELEGQTFSLTLKPNDTETPHLYRVDKVIPEHLIVVSQPIFTDDDIKVYAGFPAYGGASGGYHVFMLAEHGGKTHVTVYMEHEAVMAKGADTDTITVDKALEPWREAAPVATNRWRDEFIPTLKNLANETR